MRHRYDLSSPEATDLAPQAIPVGNVIVIDERQRVLVGQRHPDMKYEPGKWNLPGGRCEDGESYRAASARELHEEFGVKLDPDSLLYLRGYCCVYDDRVVNAVYFLAHVAESDATIRVAQDEFSTGGFHPLADVAKWELAFQQQAVIQDYLQEQEEARPGAWVRAVGGNHRQTDHKLNQEGV